MLTIRFLRVGKKNQPLFKIVVTDKRKPPRAGRFVEEVGFYNPKTKQKSLKGERMKYWLSVGASPSDTVHNLMVTEKIISEEQGKPAKKRSVHKIIKKEIVKENTSPVAETPAQVKEVIKEAVSQKEPPVVEEKETVPQQEQGQEQKTE